MRLVGVRNTAELIAWFSASSAPGEASATSLPASARRDKQIGMARQDA